MVIHYWNPSIWEVKFRQDDLDFKGNLGYILSSNIPEKCPRHTVTPPGTNARHNDTANAVNSEILYVL